MLSEFLFLERCRGCEDYIVERDWKLATICRGCAGEFTGHRTRATDCFAGGKIIQVFSAVEYKGTVQKALYRLKYDNDRLVARDLGLLLAQLIDEQVDRSCSPLLVPIPLHWARMLRRGFNQSELLAREASGRLGLKMDAKLLRRKRRTRAHHKLGREEREANVADAFAVRRDRQASPIILIDDIYTSGATLAEAAKTLFQAGFTQIGGATAAYASFIQ